MSLSATGNDALRREPAAGSARLAAIATMHKRVAVRGTKSATSMFSRAEALPSLPNCGEFHAMNLLQLFRQVWRRRQPAPTSTTDDDRSSLADLVRALDRADREDMQRNVAR